jgi:predicted lactoylglutathione lyase
MVIPARINIVTLGVSDLRRAEAFYSALGWERSTASNENIVWFKLTGAVLGLFPRHELAADAGVTDSAPGFTGVTLAINLETKQDVDAAVATAVQAGGSVVKQPVEAPWGGYSGYFADPDGFLWEVAWNPFFPIAPDGTLQMP